MANNTNAMSWTEEQKKVISVRDCNVLVSAAAGSGKTAVLVERIIQMISDKERPVDIDKLLVVTFTNAAAAEMRERINAAIEKKIEEDPDNLHLQKQGSLIRTAQITTLHSFCQNVIRNHFNEIDVDPGFRIGDEAELKLLKSDVLEELFEFYYTPYEKLEEEKEEKQQMDGEKAQIDQANTIEHDEKRAVFLELIEGYSNGKNDTGIMELLLQLYDFAMSYPWPEQWLEEKKQAFRLESIEEMEETDWMKFLLDYIREILDTLIEKNRKAISSCGEVDGPYMYQDALISDQELLEQMKHVSSYVELGEVLRGKKWARLSAKKDENVDSEKRERIKEIRAVIKKAVDDIEKQFFFQSVEQMLADMQFLARPMSTLIDLTIEFKQRYELAKEERKIVDFNDLEHMALRILVRNQNGKVERTQVAKEYSQEFAEILVDEYQDSNAVQETILNSITKEAEGKPNLFMVGDVKQSIYKFRLARPELFMEKYETYSLEEGGYRRIDLHKNFRSRAIVLDSVNRIFQQIMKRSLGNVEYDENAALYVGNTSFPMEVNVSENTELLLYSPEEQGETEDKTEEEQELSKKELEAKMVIARIQELVHPKHALQVVDKKTGMLRNCEYGDIVILLRTMSGWSDLFLEQLKNAGIPAYTDTRTGYFSTYEIRVMLQLLKVLDNPRQDIPLAAVMRSPIGTFTAKEMAIIRNKYEDMEWYDAIECYGGLWEYSEKQTEEENRLSHKADNFVKMIELFREMVPYTSIHQLLECIYEKTGFYDFVSVMPGGRQRRDNLDLLLQKAIDMESTSLFTLFHFNRYIEKLHKYEVDFGEAVGKETAGNAVRIMSIHKSKGLEFPVVFVSGMSKSFNNQDARSKMVLHLDMGLGPDCVDYKTRTKMPSLIKKTIQKRNVLENLGEELRVLYVALTRAKEKLIMTGYVDDISEQWKGWQEAYENGMDYFERSSAKCYLDWVAPVACSEQEEGFLVRIFELKDIVTKEVEKQVVAHLKKEELLQWKKEQCYQEAFRKKIEERVSYQYPYEKEKEIKSKMTVSEIKHMFYLEEDDLGEVAFSGLLDYKAIESAKEEGAEKMELMVPVPQFLEDPGRKNTGASLGTIYHKVLEKMDLSIVEQPENLELELERIANKHFVEKEEIQKISRKKIKSFIESDLANRMKKASEQNKLWKEQPFVIGIPAKEIKEEWESEEFVLIQGIIDVYFEEEDGLILLDYKTDKVQKEEQLIERYKAQLVYYQKALEQVTGKKVKEKWMYSFSLGKGVLV